MIKRRSVDGIYEKNGIYYSAFQRQEILEITFVTQKDGVEVASKKVIGRWTDYEKAEAEAEAFNRRETNEEARK